MIAHGTGITPFISILNRIKSLLICAKEQINLGDIYLFYGCRNDSDDFLYSNEIQEIYENYILKYNSNSQVFISCSRDVQGNISKPYLNIQAKSYV